MILDFLKFLLDKGVDYRVTNGYHEIFEKKQNTSDYDILIKRADFKKIDVLTESFCNEKNFIKVQVYFQDILAKNIFIYDESQNNLLNLDIYGEISRRQVKIFHETEVFNSRFKFREVLILSPQQEFIQYFIKKLDKNELSIKVFNHLLELYLKDDSGCNEQLAHFFQNTSNSIISAFQSKDFELVKKRISKISIDFNLLPKDASSSKYKTLRRLTKRVLNPTGIAIAFLGPDGSGKSTIIDKLREQHLPFRKNNYFHLKPIFKDSSDEEVVVSNPHELPQYSSSKSYLKLLYFFVQYNYYWIKNVIPLKIKSSLIIFDRYYEDLLVDKKRYRFGGNVEIAGYLRKVLFKPEVYFVLIADAKTIHGRKKEVSFEELETQLVKYRNLSKFKQFHLINVNKLPDEIVREITGIIMKYMSKRHK